ncbi:MAG: hypothetical protein H6673_14215 [Anaerolineales bacterium]|nr:hypothetical protein [Anaerolineales bacterium]
METALQDLHSGLNNAYVLFSFILGVYAAFLAARNVPISGNFWGAMWMSTVLAALVLLVTIALAFWGVNPKRGVYYLYAIWFVISLPGTYAIVQGRDDQRAALLFAAWTLFNAGAAYRAGAFLVTPWH